MLKFTEQPKLPGITSKKIMAFPGGNKQFAGDFRANLDETNADMVQFTKRWNWKWIVERQSAPNQSMHIFKAGLSSSYDVMVGQSIKKKHLMCQISIKMLKHHTIPNSSLHNLKIYSSKVYGETCQR